MYREFLGTFRAICSNTCFKSFLGAGTFLAGIKTSQKPCVTSEPKDSKHSRPRFNQSREPTNSSTFHKAKLSLSRVSMLDVTSLYCFHRPRSHGICAGKVTAIHSTSLGRSTYDKEAAVSQHIYSVAWTSEFYEGTKLNRTKKKPVTVPQSSKLEL
ncbi:hypothetical protein ARMSODRAFT_90945 [Armillaria solidipes]|uniref:Uncharacterized protein n=1 Tax=Armillaria solidipes TaxID=1076256 RepID=A0A2H3C608_9AGAR|nr:hypothetical protein ARMSODRAFT_90945 [Armillaria solidipes]